jgi:RNA polymerase sigma factor (sigma-70 family)
MATAWAPAPAPDEEERGEDGEVGACGGGFACDATLRARATWLETEILPHRQWLRRWVAQRFPGEGDVDDIVQESLERVLRSADPSIVRNARAYLGRTALGLVIDRARRRQVVCIDYHDDLGDLGLVCAYPLADAQCAAREEWERVSEVLGTLPARTREVIRLRRIEGVSQRETAEAVGVSESAIEKHVRRGVAAMRADTHPIDERNDL